LAFREEKQLRGLKSQIKKLTKQNKLLQEENKELSKKKHLYDIMDKRSKIFYLSFGMPMSFTSQLVGLKLQII
jgi:hypothetical protein